MIVLFPTTVNFSPADQMNSGDFDGDIALVIWNKDISENFNHESMFNTKYFEKELINEYAIKKCNKKVVHVLRPDILIDNSR